MKKQVKVYLIAIGLSAMCTMTSLAGWIKDDKGYWYEYDNGSGVYAKSGIKTIDGVSYAFDDNGYMLTGWQYISFGWNYFDAEMGAQAFGWKELDGKWYYLDPNNFGKMYTSWLDIGKNRYYLDESGVMKTGVFYLESSNMGSGYAYQADDNGVLIRNTTRKNGNKTIKYDVDGIMMYRNDSTSQVAEATGDEKWQYVLSEEEMEDQKEENTKIIEKAILELQNSLYDDYKSKVTSHKRAAQDEYRIAWENKTRKKLGLYQTETEVEAYILSVEKGKYRRHKIREEEQDMEEQDMEEWDYSEEIDG